MLPGLPGMITLPNQRDDDWPISKYQETSAANQPLPTPCLRSKLINPAVNLARGSCSTPLCWTWREPWLELAVNPFMLLHCCGHLILSVLGTRTLGIRKISNADFSDCLVHLLVDTGSSKTSLLVSCHRLLGSRVHTLIIFFCLHSFPWRSHLTMTWNDSVR